MAQRRTDLRGLLHMGYSQQQPGAPSGNTPEIYKGRPRITSKSETVHGGVFCPPSLEKSMEAIVVDYDKDPGLASYIDGMEKYLQARGAELRRLGRTVDFELMIRMISQKIAADFPYDKDMTDETKRERMYPAGDKVHLSRMMSRQNMVCRHMGLLAAAILDKFMNKPGLIKIEKPCVVRFMADTQQDLVENDANGHAYVVVKHNDKIKGSRNYYVIDPTGGRAIEIRECFKQKREPSPGAYRYLFSVMRVVFQTEDSGDKTFLDEFFRQAKTDANIKGIINDVLKTYSGDVNLTRRITQLKAQHAIT